MQEFVTPIIKVSKGNDTLKTFFTIPEFQQWIQSQQSTKNLKIKYYKGLGTSTSKEAKDYFSALAKHRIFFKFNNIADENAIELAFNKKFADKRKEWLEKYDPSTTFVNHSVKQLTYQDFVNKELILFSMADC